MQHNMKSDTDRHWDGQAKTEVDSSKVNLADVAQRELEFAAIKPLLNNTWRLLEVGCGNGYSTAKFRKCVSWVDAFDYSELMIERAKRDWGEQNNRFFADNVLDPQSLDPPYDAVVCVRVLINLRNLAEQKQALRTLHAAVRPQGTVILFEGFKDGFEELDRARSAVGLPVLTPAPINYYSHVADVMGELQQHFVIRSTIHLGSYDYLTRVVYPALMGADKVQHQNPFADVFQALAGDFNPEAFQRFSRMQGFVLEKRAS